MSGRKERRELRKDQGKVRKKSGESQRGIWEECYEGGCGPEDAFARNGSAPARRRVLADSILRSDRRPHIDRVNKKRDFVHEGGGKEGTVNKKGDFVHEGGGLADGENG